MVSWGIQHPIEVVMFHLQLESTSDLAIAAGALLALAIFRRRIRESNAHSEVSRRMTLAFLAVYITTTISSGVWLAMSVLLD